MKHLFLLLFLIVSAYAKVISVAYLPQCPYTCDTKSNEKGFVLDMLTEAFKKAGYDLEFIQLESNKQGLAELKEGKFDLLVYLGPGKPEGFVYMKKPLGYTSNVMAVQKYSKWRYDSPSSLKKIRLATRSELVYGDDELYNYVKKYKYDPKRVEMRSGHLAQKQNLKRLRFEKVDALIDDRIALRYFYFKSKKPFGFKIAHTSPSNPIEIAFSPKSYRSKKYAELLYKNLKKLRKSPSLKKILKNYGLSETYIAALPASH